MDYSIYKQDDRVFIEMDKDTAWFFAKRMDEVVKFGKSGMKAIHKEIYGE